MTVKCFLIHIADWFDNYILRHKIECVCQKIGGNEWWGNYCRLNPCWYCKKFKDDETNETV